MLDWLKRMMGRKGTPGDSRNTPEDLVKILADCFQKLDELTPGLHAECLAYVLDGEPQDALRAIAACPNAFITLKLSSIAWDETNPRSKLYERIGELPPPVCVRLARLLAAVPKVMHSYRTISFPLQTRWPEVLLDDMYNFAFGVRTAHSRKIPEGFSFDFIERLLEEDGLPASAVIASCFLIDPNRGHWYNDFFKKFALLHGFSAAVVRHADEIRPAFSSGSHKQSLHAIGMVEREGPETLKCFTRELVTLSAGSGQQVRAAAFSLAKKLGADALPIAYDNAQKGKADERSHVLRLIWEIGAETGIAEALDFVRQRAEVEKVQSVLSTIAELQPAAEAVTEGDAGELACPDPSVDLDARPGPEAKEVLDAGFARLTHAIEELVKMNRNAPAAKSWRPLTSAELDAVRAYVWGENPECPALSNASFPAYHLTSVAAEGAKNLRRMARELAASPGFTPVHMVRLAIALSQQNRPSFRDFAFLPQPMILCLEEMYRSTGRPTLLELEVILNAMGADTPPIMHSYMVSRYRSWLSGSLEAWEDKDVWPCFARKMELLKEWLKPGSAINREYWFDRARLFCAVGSFPKPPEQLVPQLFQLALGSGKTDRALAQAALERLPGKEKTIVEALASGKGETRAAAARWLAQLRFREAAPALEAAFKKEKNDIAIGALMDAMEELGVPVEQFIDRARLTAEAEKGLSKGTPADIAWFPWDVLPAVRWADDLSLVEPHVLKWLIVKSCKLKSPEPNSLLRRTCALFAPRDREALGQTALELWLKQDVLPIPREEAEQRASTSAGQIHAGLIQTPQYYQGSPFFGKDLNQLCQYFLPFMLNQPAGSAIGSKGVLAVAAACAGSGAAPVVARYLKQWYGVRAAQGKALIAMLAWVEHPSATQLMLSVGNRFRTKSFQDEAMRQAELLAERKGWSVSELADRTIPNAGFDEKGEMELSYGERTFVARLGQDYKIVLFNPEGKAIAGLPEPRKDEDAARAKEAKKALSSAKKEIKGIVTMQTERLYEGLCTGRTWRFEDWELYFNQHPVARLLVQRLVWAVMEDGAASAAFRPLDDGSLTNLDDEEVSLSPDARIGIAHDTNLDAGTAERWLQHLADYEVTPLFQQFGKGVYTLSEDRKDDTEINEFRGHMLNSFALRGRAMKLGYTRGPTQDGGWFFDYRKRFPAQGLEAVIEFTGNGLPETNRPVALTSLKFARLARESPNEWSPAGVRLGGAPPVLLSECYNDMRLIASEGSGFDPEWEKKSEY